MLKKFVFLCTIFALPALAQQVPDPASLSGPNNFTGPIRTKAQVPHPVVTANTTLDQNFEYYPCDATAGNVHLTIPLGSTATDVFFDVQKIDVSANTCILNLSGSDTLNGSVSTTIITGQWDDVTFRNVGGTISWVVQ